MTWFLARQLIDDLDVRECDPSVLEQLRMSIRQEGSRNVARAIHEAMHRMADDPAQPAPSLPELARRLGVSYTWFRRTFAHHTGLSPHQYRIQIKLGRARTLLGETALTVKEVAFRCGFESEHYFSRLFKRKTGVAPGEWRQSFSGRRG